jgi:ribosome-binding protein aMBF1 (putative translation factor)
MSEFAKSSGSMTNSGYPAFREGSSAAAVSESGRSNVVLFIQSWQDQTEKPPRGYKRVQDIVARNEANPERRALIERGRRQIAKDFYTDERSPLAKLRLSKGWSQARLANEIGTTQSHVARMEAGQDLLLSTVARLASALDVEKGKLASILLEQL